MSDQQDIQQFEERITRIKNIYADFEREVALLKQEHKDRVEHIVQNADQEKIQSVLQQLNDLTPNSKNI